MPLPETVQKQAERLLADFCSIKNRNRPPRAGTVSYEVRVLAITILESRPHFQDHDHIIRSKIAQLRYDAGKRLWSLFWRRHTGKWIAYSGVISSRLLEDLVGEIERDPSAVFWG